MVKNNVKKLIVFILIIFVLFFSSGILLFNERPDINGKIEPFLDSLTNKKIGLYYLNFDKFQGKDVRISVISGSKKIADRCYSVSSEGMIKASLTTCSNNIEIIMDDHAIGSFVASSYQMKNILFSEFLFGHIKIKGLRLIDTLSIINFWGVFS
jgi:hypothetical protein